MAERMIRKRVPFGRTTGSAITKRIVPLTALATESTASLGVVGLVAGTVDELAALYSAALRSVQSADCSSTSPTLTEPSGSKSIDRMRMIFELQPSSAKVTATVSPVAIFRKRGGKRPEIEI